MAGEQGEFEDDQRAVFDEIARRYDSRWMRSRWPRNVVTRCGVIEERLGPASLAGGPVVEVGCGTGQMAEVLLDRHPTLRWVGLDLSEEMVEIARARLARFGDRAVTRRVPGPLELDDEAFAGGYGVDVLHHVEEPVAVLSELHRSLRPGARATFLEGNPRFPVTTFLALVQRHERGLLRISTKRLRAWFEAAGFQSVEAVYGPTYTPPAPDRVGHLLDRVDAACARIPGLRTLALHVVATGTSPGDAELEAPTSSS